MCELTELSIIHTLVFDQLQAVMLDEDTCFPLRLNPLRCKFFQKFPQNSILDF